MKVNFTIEEYQYNIIASCLRDRMRGEIKQASKAEQCKHIAEMLLNELIEQYDAQK